MRSKVKRDLMGIVGAVALYALLMGLIESEVIGAFWQLNIVLICINVILAVSLNLITGFTGQFSIGHAGFMAVGAYLSAVMTVKLGLPYIVGILAGAAGAAILGFAIGLPTLRLKGDYLAIATLGLGEIIRITILNIPYVGGASGLMGIPRYTTFTWAFLLMVVTVLFIKNFINSSHGRACISIRENEIAAEAMGVDTTKYKVVAFTIGATFAGVAGVFVDDDLSAIGDVLCHFLVSGSLPPRNDPLNPEESGLNPRLAGQMLRVHARALGRERSMPVAQPRLHRHCAGVGDADGLAIVHLQPL